MTTLSSIIDRLSHRDTLEWARDFFSLFDSDGNFLKKNIADLGFESLDDLNVYLLLLERDFERHEDQILTENKLSEWIYEPTPLSSRSLQYVSDTMIDEEDKLKFEQLVEKWNPDLLSELQQEKKRIAPLITTQRSSIKRKISQAIED